MENVAFEIFSDQLAARYSDVADIELKFVCDNWAAVRESAAMAEVEKMVNTGELSSYAPMSLRLFRMLP